MADVRLGLRDQEAGQPAAVADTWDIDRRKSAFESPSLVLIIDET